MRAKNNCIYNTNFIVLFDQSSWNTLLRKFTNALINITHGKLPWPERMLRRRIFLHIILISCWDEMITLNRQNIISFEFELLRLMASHSIYIACESWIICPNICATLWCNQLVELPIISYVQIFLKQILKIVQEIKMVMLFDGIAKLFILFSCTTSHSQVLSPHYCCRVW